MTFQHQRTSFLRSAYKTVYFAAFIKTTYDICSQAGQFNVSGSNYLDNGLFAFLNSVFIIIIGLHTLRLYFTLEMLDDEDFIFENFFLNVKGWQRTLEFIIRMVIISIVSYKIIEWKEVSQLSTYLKWLYGSLVAWGILVKTFKPFSKTYLLISVSGLAVAYFMDILMKFEINESVGVWILFLFIVIVLIMIDVGTDIKKNKEKYLSYFKTIFADMTNLIKTNNNNKGDEIKH